MTTNRHVYNKFQALYTVLYCHHMMVTVITHIIIIFIALL